MTLGVPIKLGAIPERERECRRAIATTIACVGPFGVCCSRLYRLLVLVGLAELTACNASPSVSGAVTTEGSTPTETAAESSDAASTADSADTANASTSPGGTEESDGSAGTASASGVTEAGSDEDSSGDSTSTGMEEETFCECYDDYLTPSGNYCGLPPSPTPCTSASDCCDGTNPGCPNQYPTLFACEDSVCVPRGCESDAECQAYADANPVVTSLGCQETTAWPCDPPGAGACQYEIDSGLPPCSVDSDCCPDPMPAGYACDVDYPYRYQCSEGTCFTEQCTEDAQCAAYGASLGQDYVCKTFEAPRCYDLPDAPVYTESSICAPATAPGTCESPSDCCPTPTPTPYTCLADYPYLFDCVDNLCVSVQCEADEQCEVHGDQLGQDYQCVEW